jgi:hypothetical protein
MTVSGVPSTKWNLQFPRTMGSVPANPSWGYTRLRGALWNLGHAPAPERSKRTTWKTFLKAHWRAIAAMDFFTVEVLTWRGLVRYFVLFAIDLKTRRIHIAGIVHEAYGQWMEQTVRNRTDSSIAVFGTLLLH